MSPEEFMQDYAVRIDSVRCGYPYVDLLYHDSPLLYPDNKIRREVKVWLRDNVGARGLRWNDFTDDENARWAAFEGYDEKLDAFEEIKMPPMQHMEWRHAHMRLYFYFKDASMATLFKLTWGGR